MRQKDNLAGSRRNLSKGFSTVEMAVTLCVILILAAFASPMIVRALRTYELNDKATRLAGLVKLTRFEAIRTNTKVSLSLALVGGQWTASKNGPGANVVREVFGGSADLLPEGAPIPDAQPIKDTVGGGGGWNPLSGAAGFIRFDSRGAVDFQGAPFSVQVLYIGSADSSAGYRAVLVLPSGATQVWTTSSTGNWQRTS
jgi:hypothetical protein